ncbi:MAG: T9SS type A sorting domain-containing protein [Paludibacter sp.]|nr:T9SS type A sorting domain-containing protein [Paludibacter sp.]
MAICYIKNIIINLKNKSLAVSTPDMFCEPLFLGISKRKDQLINNYNSKSNIIFQLRLFIFLFISIGILQTALGQSQPFTSSGTFTVPAGVTSVNVECWGGGGSGGGNTSNKSRGGGGGAGGTYALKIITVTPGNTYTVTVAGTKAGINGVGAKGNPSWFGTTSTVYAEGGNGGTAPNGGNVAGGTGSTSSSIGDILYAGGNGAGGTSTLSGGGGGGAGSTGVGGNASGITAGLGKTIDGGNGGTGFNNTESNGNSGSTFGGGGSGAYLPDNSNHSGGTGAAGQVVVTWITVSATSTETCIGGSTGTITATVNGGNTPYSYTLNGGTPQAGNVFTNLSAGSYIVVVTDNLGRKASSTLTVSSPSVSTDNQNLAGSNNWIGHVYDGTNQSILYNGSFTNYFGTSTETETFDESFGGATNCYSITSSLGSRSIYTETFSVRYRMNSTKKGLYTVDLGADDGSRLTVDGNLVYNNWSDQAYSSKATNLITLTGSSSLVYDFYENGGGNRVVFQNLTQILANNLATNTTQSINLGNSGSAISGDVFGTLPTGISLSGTGYQWTYSTTPAGSRTPISGSTGATYTPNTTVAPFNVAGTYYIFRNAILSSANNISPNPYVATSESNYATLVVNNPLITVNPTSLTGFSYIFGSGPSAQQSFTVGGTYLIANISVAPSTNYEISSTSGSGFQSTPITLTQSGGTIATTTIYVRLKAGLAVGSYNSENIVSTSTSAVTKNVTCSGTVNNIPLITVAPTTLTGFSYIFGNGPSAQQSFTVGGTYLIANIIVTPSANYEISTSSVSGFASNPINLTQIGGTVATTTIYVRLKAGLAVGSYNLENIVSTSTYAVTKNVACSGTVSNVPLIITTPTSLTGFSYIFGSGPSAQQSFTVSGTYLVGNISITPSTNYEISTTSGNGFQSTPLTLTQSGGTVNSTTIYVRLKTGLAVGNYNSEDIVSTSTSAVTKNVTCSGIVTIPTISVAPNSLTGLNYIIGTGPSVQQTFVVNGTFLTSNISITPSTNFEISTTSGSNFQQTPITLTQDGGNIGNTTIYVRLKAGLVAGNYNSENITLSSTGATSKTVSCSGTVGSPTIVTSTSTLTGFSYPFGSGPSSEQFFTVSATFVTTNLTITTSANFEISKTSGSGFQSTPIVLTQTGGTVNTTTIYVRLKAGLAIGSYSLENIVCTSSGAPTKNVVVSGSVFTAYCPSTGDMQDQSGTTLVNFNTINNISLTKTVGYSDFTASQSTNVIVGNTYALTVNLNTGGAYTQYATAWIDWNNNGNFNDTGETYNLGTTTNLTNGVTTLSPLNITVPEGAVVSSTRMRVSSKWNVAPTSCETIAYGEVEDYSINIIARSISTGTISGSPFTSGGSVSVPFTISGNFTSGNIFTAQLSNANGSFASPVTIGTLTSTTSGTISATIPGNSAAGTGYRIRIMSSLPLVTGTANMTNLTIIAGTPTITTSPTSLTGFSYPYGNGPSAIQSFVVSGTNLNANITITPSANFEISTVGGTSFEASSIITLPVSSGLVANTTIYVRMKSGIALGALPNENIISASSGATSNNVVCSGSVVIAPVITTSTISGTCSYTFGTGPSSQQTFTVSGANLTANVILTPPTNYEISTTSGSGFASTPIILTQTGGTLTSRTIYVRLKIGLGVGSYAENVVATSTNAITKNIALSGSIVSSATIFNPISFLSGFIYNLGSGPSGIQSFIVKASALTADVTVAPPTNFEISKNDTTFVSTNLTLTRNGSVLTTDTIVYVRMKSALPVGTYGPLSSSVVLTSSGAITKSVACTGQVVNTKTILVSKNTLTGFGYEYSASPVGGPSSPQSFTVSGASLTGNIIISAPVNYEISQNAISGYLTTITLTEATVNPTLIYVRLKSGLSAANYGTLASPVLVSVATSGATTLNISCVGKVFSSPLITASGGGNFCEGSTINLVSSGADIQSQYWLGPNSFYSTLASPSLTTNATSNLSGTYTVNGNVIVGGNLITNGDFSAGNTSFSSGYGYVAPSAAALNPEGLYTIVNLPSAVHADFTNYPDHTTGTGLQMVVNGSPTAGVVVWSQSVPVIPGATYQFAYSEQTVNITQVPKNASQLQLYVNGVAAGTVYTAPLVNYQWATFLYNASAGTNNVLNLELINQNTVATGNDFALDDIIFQQILPATSTTNVSVNPIVPVSVTVNASPGTTVYSNTPVTFTATPTNGGSTPVYQWKVNGINVGTNSTIYIYSPKQGDIVSCTLTSSLTCVTNNPATANVNMNVIQRLNFWMGYTDTDWGKSENWTNNLVPLTGDDVEYATVANFGTSAMRDLWLDHDRTIGSLINATTKRLVIPAAKGLTVNNTVNTDGNVDRIYIYSSSTLANGSLSFNNIESMPVSATVEMYSKASFDRSQAVNNRFKWQYFGSPLRSVTVNPTFYSGLDSTYVRRWDETGTAITNHWLQLSNESVLQPFYGYEICQKKPRTYFFKGQLVNSNFNSGQLAITPTALFPGQHVFANPYTAAIDIRQLTFGASTQATVYLYNTGTFSDWQNDGGFTSGNSEGQYVAVPTSLAGSSGLPLQVPSMQAILVKAQNLSSDAYFGINYNAVIMNNTDLQRAKSINENTSDKVCTRIDVKGKQSSDKMWIFTEPGCSRNFDNGWDGYKFLGSALSPQIFAKELDGNYQVTAVGDMNNTNIYFQAGNEKEYTLIFTQNNLKRFYEAVYLVDLIENKTIDITESRTEYTFSTESTPEPINRFSIVTRPYEAKATDINSQVKIFNAGKTIFIHNLSAVEGELTIYDISGRKLKKATFSANGITAISTNYISGGYIVRAQTSLDEVSKRIIIRK